MWSASSSTVIPTSSSVMSRWLRRSSSRPGQATTMSTPASRAATCRDWETPPKIVVVRRPDAAASGASGYLNKEQFGVGTLCRLWAERAPGSFATC